MGKRIEGLDRERDDMGSKLFDSPLHEQQITSYDYDYWQTRCRFVDRKFALTVLILASLIDRSYNVIVTWGR
jgi:hypothetical protein